MALCDRLEAAQAERERRRDRLVAASRGRLSQPAEDDAKTFRDHARFHLDHLQRLATRVEHVQKLRAAIHSLAVRGLVIRQDLPTDNTAEPQLPIGWNLLRCAEVCSSIVDGDHNPPHRQLFGVPHLTARNVSGGRISLDGCTFISQEDFEKVKRRYMPKENDVLLTCVGTLGRTAVVPSGSVFSADRNLAALRPIPSICLSRYLKILLDSPDAQDYLLSSSGKTAQPHIYLKAIRELEIPLPPLAEQHRIVAKVDQLMALCDQLEAQLTTAQSESRRLLEAVLHEALAPAA